MVVDRLVHTQIKDPKISVGGGLKGSFGVLNSEGEHTAQCVGCKKELRFTETLLNCTLHAAACSRECAASFVWPEIPREIKVVRPVEPDLPDDADDDELELPEDQPKPRVVQPPAEPKPPCPKCGGPARGKGYSHNQVDGKPCPDSTEAKLAAAKAEREAAKANAPPKEPKPEKPPVETCPQCGGPKRGRGYSHNEGCPATIKEPAEPKPPREPKKPARPPSLRGKRMPKGMLEE